MKRQELAGWAKRSAAKVTGRAPTYMTCDGCARRFPLADLRPDAAYIGLFCDGCWGATGSPGVST